MYDLFKVSGAGNRSPGRGRFNTTWNLQVITDGNFPPDQPLLGRIGRPDARVISLHGNRAITHDFTPDPYIEVLNQEITSIPSLYDYQLGNR